MIHIFYISFLLYTKHETASNIFSVQEIIKHKKEYSVKSFFLYTDLRHFQKRGGIIKIAYSAPFTTPLFVFSFYSPFRCSSALSSENSKIFRLSFIYCKYSSLYICSHFLCQGLTLPVK